MQTAEQTTQTRALRVLLFGQAAVLSAGALITAALSASAGVLSWTVPAVVLGTGLFLAFAAASIPRRLGAASASSLLVALVAALSGAWPLTLAATASLTMAVHLGRSEPSTGRS